MTNEERVIKIIASTFDVSQNSIGLESNIVDLAQDSIQLFELIINLEKEFNHKAQYEDLMDITTVGDIIEYVATVTKTTQ